MAGTPWFVDAFQADYLDVYAHRDEASAAREVRAVLSMLRFDPRRGRLLDLAAGGGRHGIAFRAERCAVTCLDLSVDLTRRCLRRGLTTVRGDMRRLPFRDWSFHGVAMLFSSFGYFQSEGEHLLTMREIGRVLEPGGSALLDLMDPDTVRYQLVPQSVELLEGMTVETERAMSDDGLRVEKQIRLLRDGSTPRSWHESVRLFTGDELSHMAERSRLEIETEVGDYDGRAYEPGETRRILVLRKPRD